MQDRPSLVFVCAHLCDERLYAPQLAVLLEPQPERAGLVHLAGQRPSDRAFVG